jgi:chromosome partitioning protein
MSKPHVIVLGNEKGGSGKSTTAMHIVSALIAGGHRVAALDLDGRQKSLARYIENRRSFADKKGLKLIVPAVTVLQDENDAADKITFATAFNHACSNADVVVIDCPGRDSVMSREAHAHADTLITPMNDSFVDLDLLATIDSDTFKVIRPSFYAELVWKCRQQRAQRDRGNVDWIVLRNRLSHLEARNMRRVGAALDELAKRIGFRVAPGLSERVIYRELFLKGLTLLDLKDAKAVGEAMNMSHVAARQELREIITALRLPGEQPTEVAA